MLTFLLIFMAVCLQINQAEAQVTVLRETFEDRDLTTHPAWSGDLDDFSFVEEFNTTMLRLDTEPDPSRTQITTISSTTTGSWEFYFRQEFSPSNLNRAFVFLMADRDDLNYLDGSNVNGYAVRTGDNQSPRRLKLVRFDNGNQTVLTETDTVIEEGTGYRVKVIRSEDGVWSLFISADYESEPEEDAATVTDLTYISSSHFGLLLRYSSGNVDKFYFDDFTIRNYEPFKMLNAEVVKAEEVSVQFSYPLDPESVTTENVIFNGLPDPVSAATGPSDQQARFIFDEIIPNGEYSVEVNNIHSKFGDELTGSRSMSFSYINPFFVTESEIITSRSIQVTFSEALLSSSLEAVNFLTNETFYPVHVHQVSPETIELGYTSQLPPGAVSIGLHNIESINGWKIADGTMLTTYRFEEAESGSIAINEILYRRAAADTPQFVEIYNNSAQVFNLSGWRLETDRGGTDLSAGTVISGKDYLVFTDNPVFSEPDERIIHLQQYQALRTTGDAVVLRNASGMIIDSLYYQPEWGGNQPGISLERKDPGALSIDPLNWADSRAETGSTPLQKNSRYEPDITAPVLEFVSYQPGEQVVLARFNEFVKKLPETAVFLDGNRVSATTLDDGPGPELQIAADEIPLDRESILEVDQISDYQGNVSATQALPVSKPIQHGDLVFNEIMFDPLQDDYDGLPNQTEYIEFINRRNYAVSLEGVYLHDQPDEMGEVNKMLPVTSRSSWIPGGGYTLFQAENNHQEFENSGNARFFGLSDELAPHVLRFDRSTLSLPMAGREIYLADSLGGTIDRVDYNPDWHNPNLIDTKGISMERINPAGETNDPDNWGSNTMAIGGTPGRENSLHQTPAGVSDLNSISLEPNPFSPDDDGHEDHLFINYSFDDPDFMLRVRIFDRYGRLVRNLADSHQAGLEGVLIWDGRMDNGVTGRIGIYIVHIEAFNSMTGKRLQFKETAVLARQF